MYLLYEVPEEDGLLSQGIMNQALRKEDHPMGEVVLGQPGHNALLLHVRAASDVDDQVSQVLPMSTCKYITSNPAAGASDSSCTFRDMTSLT